MRIPLTIEIDPQDLRQLLQALQEPGSDDAVAPLGARKSEEVELPPAWRPVEVRHGVVYTWGEDRDVYDPFSVYEATLSTGGVKLAVGRCERARTFGEDRIYYIVTSIGPEGGIRAISEFLATDDYEQTNDVIAIVKGKEGSARLFDRPEELPSVYAPMQTVTYRDRVDYPGAFQKQAVVCNEQDHETMLNHSLAQIQLRGLGI